MESPVSVRDYSHQYLENRVSVIPICSPSVPEHNKEKCEKAFCKHPLLDWREFQKRLPTQGELIEWDERWPGHNIAVICGEVSGNLIALDVEAGRDSLFVEWLKEMNTTLWTPLIQYRTGSGGFHVWLRTSYIVRKKKMPWGDIQAEGCYVIVPPSIHASGGQYTWI